MSRLRSVVVMTFAWVAMMTFAPSLLPRHAGDTLAGLSLGAAFWTAIVAATVALLFVPLRTRRQSN